MLCREPYSIESGDSSCGETWAGRDHSDIMNMAWGCSSSLNCLQSGGQGTFCTPGWEVPSRLAQPGTAPACSGAALPSLQQQGKELFYFISKHCEDLQQLKWEAGRQRQMYYWCCNYSCLLWGAQEQTMRISCLNWGCFTQWTKCLPAWSKGCCNSCWDMGCSHPETVKRKINLLVSGADCAQEPHADLMSMCCEFVPSPCAGSGHIWAAVSWCEGAGAARGLCHRFEGCLWGWAGSTEDRLWGSASPCACVDGRECPICLAEEVIAKNPDNCSVQLSFWLQLLHLICVIILVKKEKMYWIIHIYLQIIKTRYSFHLVLPVLDLIEF